MSVSYTHLKVTLEAIMEKLKADGYKSGYTTEIQDIRKVWEEERLRVLGAVSYTHLDVYKRQG